MDEQTIRSSRIVVGDTKEIAELQASLDKHYRAVASADLDLAALQRRRTGEYYDLGEVATELKSRLEHGEWLPFLKERGYVERTIQRAMRIHRLFKGKRDECLALTVEEAESFGKAATETPASTAKRASDNSNNALLGAPRETERLASKTEVTLREKPGAPLDDLETERQEPDEAEAVKSELLWGILSEVKDNFEIAEPERKAFEAFVIAIADEKRAVQVAMYHVWNTIQPQ